MKEIHHLNELSVDRKILEGIGGTWSGLIWRKIGQSPECYEHGNEASASIKFREFLGCLDFSQLCRKGPALWNCLYGHVVSRLHWFR